LKKADGRRYPAELADFCASDCDRLAFVSRFAKKHKIPGTVVDINGARHFIIRFRDAAYDGSLCVKNLVAHYDRGAASPGANDNAAAVFQLFALAERLKASGERHNVQIVFTGNEELDPADRIERQGSYMLARAIRRIRPTDVFFVFDVCGVGDVAILSDGPGDSPVRRRFDLPRRALRDALRPRLGGRLLELPIPYSDNLGILKAGSPAAALTVLPRAEAARYAAEIGRSRDFLKSIRASVSDTPPAALSEGYPDTWRRLHTPYDTAATLDDEAYVLMETVLEAAVAIAIPITEFRAGRNPPRRNPPSSGRAPDPAD
jgi:hypothetical protein